MAALFPEWSNTAMRIALVMLFGGLFGLPAALMIYTRSPYGTGQGYAVSQPIEFDHRHHVGDDGIDCRYCHDEVERSPYAGVPPTELCMNCHSQIWNDSPLLETLRQSIFTGQPIPWRRVHKLPDHVYFNHSIHVTRGIGCVSCHGRIDRMAAVYQDKPLTMAWCLGCHRNPGPNLRPQEVITQMDWKRDEHVDSPTALIEHYGTRRLTNCTTCHR